jgi:hypothetical protein
MTAPPAQAAPASANRWVPIGTRLKLGEHAPRTAEIVGLHKEDPDYYVVQNVMRPGKPEEHLAQARYMIHKDGVHEAARKAGLRPDGVRVAPVPKRADVLRALPINRHFAPEQVVAKMKVNGVEADVGEVGKVLEELAKTDRVEKLGDKYRRTRRPPNIKPRGKVEVVGVEHFKSASEFKREAATAKPKKVKGQRSFEDWRTHKQVTLIPVEGRGLDAVNKKYNVVVEGRELGNVFTYEGYIEKKIPGRRYVASRRSATFWGYRHADKQRDEYGQEYRNAKNAAEGLLREDGQIQELKTGWQAKSVPELEQELEKRKQQMRGGFGAVEWVKMLERHIAERKVSK